MNVNQLDKEIKNGELGGIYILYGEEEYLLENTVKKMIKAFGETVYIEYN